MSIFKGVIADLPQPLKQPVGEVLEWGRDFVEEWLKEVLGMGIDQFGGITGTKYWDPHLAVARKDQLLKIMHVPSKKKIGLFADLTSLSNSYNVGWGQEPVYGRADPIPSYQNTSRSITINFKLTAANLAEARFNYNKTLGRGGKQRVSLTNMMYPTYKNIQNYRTIASPPILAIKHVQLLQSYGSSVDGGFLVGYLTNCSMTPNFEGGAYEDGEQGNFIYPKVIDIGMGFNVLHDYDQGFEASTGFIAELFPELGTGEDIGTALGGKLGGEFGALVGAAGGILADAGLDSVFYNNEPDPNDGIIITPDPNDTAPAGDAPSPLPVPGQAGGPATEPSQPGNKPPAPSPPPSTPAPPPLGGGGETGGTGGPPPLGGGGPTGGTSG